MGVIIRYVAWIVISITLLAAIGTAGADWEQGQKAAQAGDLAAAIRVWRPLAEKGDPRAQYSIGKLYGYGEGGLKRDDSEAVRWYRKAAEQGHNFAQFDLAVRYTNGQGVVKSGTEAVKWYEKSAAQGVVDAQFNLGQLYLRGDLIEKDIAKAARYYSLAARQGSMKAQAQLGQMYLFGKGVNKDHAWAYVWLSLALAGAGPEEKRSELAALRNQAEIKMTAEEMRRASDLLLRCLRTAREVCGEE
jgi:uncharacterized protein